MYLNKLKNVRLGSFTPLLLGMINGFNDNEHNGRRVSHMH